MTEGGSGKGLGLFGKKGLKTSEITLCIISKYDRDEFFQSLKNYGWEEVEDAFEFERKWDEKHLRKAAKEHAAEILADLVVEVKDNDYSTNPFNDYVYYTWRSGPNTRGLPPQPSQSQSRMMNQQMQFLAEQQRALIQQQQMIQRMQMQVTQPQQMPMQPGVAPGSGTPQGQVCSRCGGNQIQYMANGMAKCMRCGFMFQWQQMTQQQAPPQPQAQQQPTPQPVPQPTPQPKPKPTQTQPQAQMPKVTPPVKPGAPTPPGSKPCPKCGGPLNIFPDGSFFCNKCGYTGK
jgi:hypothetical protein